MEPDMHGVPLIERVIEAVMAESAADDARGGWCGGIVIKDPQPLAPDVLAALRLPGGKPLPPSLRRWLEFDASWLAALEWFSDGAAPVPVGRTLSEVVDHMYGSEDDGSPNIWAEMFGDFETLLPGACFPLEGGSDSRRLLYVGEPDSTGEYPVLVTDIDDMPYVAVMYPGFDVYLAHHAGIIDLKFSTYTSLAKSYQYGLRMREHAENTKLGANGLEFHDLYQDPYDDEDDEDDED